MLLTMSYSIKLGYIVARDNLRTTKRNVYARVYTIPNAQGTLHIQRGASYTHPLTNMHFWPFYQQILGVLHEAPIQKSKELCNYRGNFPKPLHRWGFAKLLHKGSFIEPSQSPFGLQQGFIKPLVLHWGFAKPQVALAGLSEANRCFMGFSGALSSPYVLCGGSSRALLSHQGLHGGFLKLIGASDGLCETPRGIVGAFLNFNEM